VSGGGENCKRGAQVKKEKEQLKDLRMLFIPYHRSRSGRGRKRRTYLNDGGVDAPSGEGRTRAGGNRSRTKEERLSIRIGPTLGGRDQPGGRREPKRGSASNLIGRGKFSTKGVKLYAETG